MKKLLKTTILIFCFSLVVMTQDPVFALNYKMEYGHWYCIDSNGIATVEATEAQVEAGYCDGATASGSTGVAGSAKTVLLNECGAKEGVEAIGCLVSTVVSLFSIAVGALGVLGIVICGIQYMTAGGNESQMTKAKRRMLEIGIGLLIFAIFGAVQWWLGN